MNPPSVSGMLTLLSCSCFVLSTLAPAFGDSEATSTASSDPVAAFPGTASDFHGYVSHDFVIDGCNAHLVEPKVPLASKAWIWRTMFWDAFPGVDLALLARGYYVAFIDVGDTFGSPDSLVHYEPFYSTLTQTYGLSKKPAMEGLSRGGMFEYRWASMHPDQVGCIYGDAPLCDIRYITGDGRKQIMNAYHLATDQDFLNYNQNPIDILAPIAKRRIPIIHDCGDADDAAPMSINTDVLRERYMKLGGNFALIVKQGCQHHPHGLTDPTPIVDFIVAYTAGGDESKQAMKTAIKPGTILTIPQGQW